MKRTGSKGMMAFWADIVPAQIENFRRWHNCEHMTERCSIPGFNVGRRYAGLGAAPTFFMFYETETASVLASEAYHARLNAPTAWSKSSLTYFRNADRNIYSLLAEDGAPAPTEAPFLATLRFDLVAETADEMRETHIGAWNQALAAAPEVFRSRLYEIDREVTGIMTAERSVYGGAPAMLNYLAVIEAAVPDLGPIVARADGASAAARTNVRLESFWLDMAMYAPGSYGD